ncbi:MAG TPA: SH3 domain-containing protein [Candidatus Limnocylindrales bacterium]|nr:SH3 domain-containing protein [Candidatus Limnocylindrales bacterium]
MRRAFSLLVMLPVLAGCLVAMPTSIATPLATPSPSVPIATPTPPPTPSPLPTPGPSAVPQFSAGGQAATNAPGLRVRSRPGVDQRVITSLGVDADLLIGLGPVWVDGLGWYLVRDADTDDPEFGEGWVAAGFEPDPFLIPASFEVRRNPYIAGFAHDADGEFGPVLLTNADVSIRWIAAPPTSDGCSFYVNLTAGSGEPLRAIRATVGGVPAPGELFRQFFAEHPRLIESDLFVSVESDCSWALTFVQERPAR